MGWRICLSYVAAFVLLAATSMAAERFTFHHEHVLGTSLEIQVEAENRSAADAAEARVLTEIERLAKVFSSYDADSELCLWEQRIGEPTPISQELFDVLAACELWQQRSQGAFHPAVERLTQLWQVAEQRKRLPSTDELSTAVALIQKSQWSLDAAARTATRLSDGPLSLNAIAKGTIIDRACEAALSDHADVYGVLVCIGGDLRVRGDIVQPVHIVDPRSDAENAAPAATVHLHNRSLATSGNYRRGFRIESQWYSHILDPRTGIPANEIASATVVADTAADADALATIFNVLTTSESAALAESLPNVEYLLIACDGRRLVSPGWSDLEQPQLFRLAVAVDQIAQVQTPKAAKGKTPTKPLLELVVNLELAQTAGAVYRRPYVAVWLENADEFPVRTALLFLQTKDPGPKWHRHLTRWYRNDAVRRLNNKQDLIGTISGATRGPGQYKAVFDGNDDAGNPLRPGKYTLFIEVAREKGTYQLIRHPLTLGTRPIAPKKLQSNVEIKSASVEYRVPTLDKQPER